MQLYLRDLYLGTYYQYYVFRPLWAIFWYHVYKNVKKTAAWNTNGSVFLFISYDIAQQDAPIKN
jgi:hypothetical protein